MATGSSALLSVKAGSLSSARSGTMEGLSLATSMPTESLRVTMRTPLALSDIAMSSWSMRIDEILTPGAG